MSKQIVRISSRDNQKIKYARQIRDGKEKNRIFIEGIRVCEEALRAKINITEAFFDENFVKSYRENDLIENLSGGKTDLYQVSEQVFSSIADTKTSQGIILIAEKPDAKLQEIETNLTNKSDALVLFLYEINNPANLGAILRTAEAAGVSGVIISKKSADIFSQKSIRAAMGAVFRVPIWENADFYEAVEWAKNNKLTTVAADIRSTVEYTKIAWKKPRLLIFGSEAHGLPVEKLNYIEDKIYIAMENEVESLNLAVSCGIILFEWKKAVNF